MKKTKTDAFTKRIHEIDFLRGFLIILVIMDHLFWNLGHYGIAWNIPWMEGFFYHWYWEGEARRIIQPLALMAFCFVSGISCAFSRNNWKRAIETLVVWAIIAIGSNVLQLTGLFGSRAMRIDFNIIGVLGFSMLFYCFIQKRSNFTLMVGIFITFIIWAVIPYISEAVGDVYGTVTFRRSGNDITVPNFYMPLLWEPVGQADYVSLFPYITWFFVGALLTRFLYKDRKSIIKHRGDWERPVCFLGRHTLVIYLSHEFILMGIFALLDVIIGG